MHLKTESALFKLPTQSATQSFLSSRLELLWPQHADEGLGNAALQGGV